MWDTVTGGTPGSAHLSHDLPCLRCGHAAHRFLACDDDCGCPPASMPGTPADPDHRAA